jgi:hypothetical protein
MTFEPQKQHFIIPAIPERNQLWIFRAWGRK